MKSHADDCTCMICVPTVKTWTVSGPVPNCSAPPLCDKHAEQMVLYMYERPGGPPGNGWCCRSCVAEREAKKAEATVFDLVKADLDGRDMIGTTRHGGMSLLANVCQCGHPRSDHGTGGCGPTFAGSLINCPCNDYRGRDRLRETYKEALDLCVYLRGALADLEKKK